MKKFVWVLMLVIATFGFSQEKYSVLTGKVTVGGNPLPGVTLASATFTNVTSEFISKISNDCNIKQTCPLCQETLKGITPFMTCGAFSENV